MRLKRYSVAMLHAGLFLFAFGAIAPLFSMHNGNQAGIIGGADTPTYMFAVFQVMNGWPFCGILFGGALMISALFCLAFSKTVKENCSIKTTALSVGLSAVGAMGLVCAFVWFAIVAFDEMSKHPVAYPASIGFGLACLGIFVFLIAVYLQSRKSIRSVKGLCIDVLTSILYLPAFFFLFSCLYEAI